MSAAIAILERLAAAGVRLQGISDDSRVVRPGDVFLAYADGIADRRRYIPDALARGGAAVVWEAGEGFAWRAEWTVPNFAASGLRPLAGPLAHAVLGEPSRRLSLVAVTGTNGKTSCSHWIAEAHARRCAIVGTLGAGFPGALADTGFTTPEATTLARCLADFSGAGADACALEVSSIGVEEGRLNGALVDVAAFTNLTRDHLDYHGTMEAYAAAKEKLFRWPGLRAAVINLDDPFGRQLAASTTARLRLGYTLGDASAAVDGLLRAEDLTPTAHGFAFTLVAPQGRIGIVTRLIGRYNVSNLLAVAGVLLASGASLDHVAARFAALTPPAGRMQCIGGLGEPLLAIDYAHTPDALASALAALREQAAARGGKLLCVFGCGGERDSGKRPLMGEAATRLADRVVLTSDNPRGESPEQILDHIRVGAPTAEVVADRAAAIRRATLEAEAQDVVLIAGKGHEPYQEIAGVRRPFSDLAEAKSALAARRELTQ